jgi:hypothetical protein
MKSFLIGQIDAGLSGNSSLTGTLLTFPNIFAELEKRN